MQTQHPGAYRRSARPSSGREMEKEENEAKKGGKKMKVRKTSS